MSYPKNWSPFDGDVKDEVKWTQAKMRLNKARREPNRIKTGISGVDEALGGGLPEGLVILYGPGGCGKSLFARTIAGHFAKQKKKVLYIYGEDSFDAPKPNPPIINTVDLKSYRPGPPRAVKTILKYVMEMKPDLVVVDSLTTILAQPTGHGKAVPEADVREWTGELAKRLSGVVPVLAISEVRGGGKYESPAGGRGVEHAGLALLYFGSIKIENKWDAQDWEASIGTKFWTLSVDKDRDGAANQSCMYRVTYMSDEIFLEEIGGGY